MIARLSASVRSVSTCGWSPPGSGGRTGSAPVASSSASQATSRPSASVSLWPAGSMLVDARAQRQRDLLLAEERGRAQRHPLFGRVARQVVLRQVRAIDGRRFVGAEQQDLAVVALAAQRLGRRFARRARADDGDGPQRRAAPQRHRSARARADADQAVGDARPRSRGSGSAPGRGPARPCADRSRRGATGSGRCRRRTVPRRAGRRSACRSRRSPARRRCGAAADGLAAGVPEQRRLAGEIAYRDAGLQIGAGELGVVSTHAA